MWQKFGLTKEFRGACGLPSVRTESMDRSLEHLILTENISFSCVVYWEIKSAFCLSALTITEHLLEQFSLSPRIFLEMSRRQEMSFWKNLPGSYVVQRIWLWTWGLSVLPWQQWKQMLQDQFSCERQVLLATLCSCWVIKDVEQMWAGPGKQAPGPCHVHPHHRIASAHLILAQEGTGT